MKTIVAIFFALGALLASLIANGQSKSDKMYNAFENIEGVTNFSFAKNMNDAINIDFGNEDEKSVKGDLHQVRFMSYNPNKGDISGLEFTQKAIGYLPKLSYKKHNDETEDDLEIWLLGRKKKYKECHVFTRSNEENKMRYVVSFYGDFTVNDIDKLKNSSVDFSKNEN